MTKDALIMMIEGVRTRVSTSEILVTLSVPLENAALVSALMGRIGRQVGVAFAELERDQPFTAPEQPKAYGEHAKALKLSGFFLHPEVWACVGSDESFLAWVRLQKSAHSGEYTAWVDGEGRCEAAHVSRIEYYGRGVGHKPAYSAIPLTHAEHMLTHARGESALRPREWFEEQRNKYVSTWAWQKCRELLGYDSMAKVPPSALYGWASFHNLDKFLPKEYTNGAEGKN